MQGKFLLSGLGLISMLVVLNMVINQGCKKSSETTEERSSLPPVLTTSSVINIDSTSVKCGGNITAQGTFAITARSVCWSMSPNPTIADTKTSDGSGSGSFTSTLSGLSPATPYYVRAYATNANLTGYGSVVTFTTTGSGTGTVHDVDGNVYHTVTIGMQVWLVNPLHPRRKENPVNDGAGMRRIISVFSLFFIYPGRQALILSFV